ncbi:MAG: hydrolase [Acidobacteria bacterium]|nr:hydrolase [Acidobacteriota bacterium]
MFFQAEAGLLLVIDVQEKLWPLIANKEQVRDRCRILMEGAKHLGVPVILSEQYPKGLGSTIEEIRQNQADGTPVCSKTAFGCLGDAGLAHRIGQSGRRQLVLCGIEAHVCVMQTALEAIREGYRVAVVADAVGSRDEANRRLGLERARAAGATIVSSEMMLFEWMRDSRHPAFKAISALIK